MKHAIAITIVFAVISILFVLIGWDEWDSALEDTVLVALILYIHVNCLKSEPSNTDY